MRFEYGWEAYLSGKMMSGSMSPCRVYQRFGEKRVADKISDILKDDLTDIYGANRAERAVRDAEPDIAVVAQVLIRRCGRPQIT